MRTIIAGSRDITDSKLLQQVIDASDIRITEVVSGAARGVDKLGEQYARLRGIPIKQFPAMWDTYGKSAGYKRNQQMAVYADALIAVWDGVSRGTAHMIRIAQDAGLTVYVHCTNPNARLPQSNFF